MKQKTLLIAGGAALLLLVLYLATRGNGSGSTSYVVSPSAPADPNVLAAQVAQDQIKGQIALATINAAGSYDIVNAQSRGTVAALNAAAAGDVQRINASYSGQSSLARISGQIANALATLQYNNATNMQVASAPVPVAPSTSTATGLSITGTGAYVPGYHGEDTGAALLMQPAQQQVQQQAQDCWWRRNVPLIGAFVC